MIDDIGLRSYQDIEEPAGSDIGVEPPSIREWEKKRDEALVELFQAVLEVQAETGVPIWFSWVPHTDGVTAYAPIDNGWSPDCQIDYIFSNEYFEYPKSPIDTEESILDYLWSWRDRRLARNKIGQLKGEITEKQKQIAELKGKFGIGT